MRFRKYDLFLRHQKILAFTLPCKSMECQGFFCHAMSPSTFTQYILSQEHKICISDLGFLDCGHIQNLWTFVCFVKISQN